jgi:hypothetical protein
MTNDELKKLEQQAKDMYEVLKKAWEQQVEETSFLTEEAREEILESIGNGIETDRHDTYDKYMYSTSIERGFCDETDEFLLHEWFNSLNNANDIMAAEIWQKHGQNNLKAVAVYTEWMKEVGNVEDFSNPER